MPSDEVRIYDLEEEIEDLRGDVSTLEDKLKKLAQVLRFYADEDNYPREDHIHPDSEETPIAVDRGQMASNILYEVVGY